MSAILSQLRKLVSNRLFKVSEHGLAEIDEDDISLAGVVIGLADCRVVEDYPDAWKGPSVLVLETLPSGDQIHALWGIPKAGDRMAVLITAYRPDPSKWFPDLLKRRPK